MNKYTRQIHITTKKALSKKWVFAIALSIPILIFFYQYIATGNRLLGGDFDYYAQMYEAFRISVLKFGQLPLWNPWMSGGIPLFANPQFGLVSIQSFLCMVFGTIYGLKLAYVSYAVAGFWGMYYLGKKVVGADTLKSVLIAYIWIFSGFFAGHNISHFTFALFFLMPWIIVLIHNRRNKYAWLWLGLLESLIILSSIHYAFIMTTVAAAIYFFVSLLSAKLNNKRLSLTINIEKSDFIFAFKSVFLTALLCAYRFAMALQYTSANSRIVDTAHMTTKPDIIFQAIFLPIGSLFNIPKNIQWGWGEYSMYIGIGAGIAFVICVVSILKKVITRSKAELITNRAFVLPIVIVGLVGLALTLGDFGKFSPYHILHILPGISQTRVPSRWLIMTAFTILVFLLSCKSNRKIINCLLLLSVAELFLTYGPPNVVGQDQVSVPNSITFSQTFTQYDNGRKHLDLGTNINHSYYYSTTENIGQVYSDDSVVDTLDGVYNTSKCGKNVNNNCSLVLSGNASVAYWSPNKISIQRDSTGEIVLNMNVQDGWMVNGEYIFIGNKYLDPNNKFVIADKGEKIYNIEYAPKLSPRWVVWKITHK